MYRTTAATWSTLLRTQSNGLASLKMSWLVLALVTLFLTGCDSSNEPQQGVHYDVIQDDLSALISDPVVEVFSLTCGHCKNLEAQLPKIKKAYGGEISKVHVTFNDSSRNAALFFYAGLTQLNGDLPSQFMAGLFDVYHGSYDNADERIAFLNKTFADAGIVSPYDLSDAQVQTALTEVKNAEQITLRGKINSVPTFIVNGKYRVNLSAHDSAEAIAKTLTYLTQL